MLIDYSFENSLWLLRISAGPEAMWKIFSTLWKPEIDPKLMAKQIKGVKQSRYIA